MRESLPSIESIFRPAALFNVSTLAQRNGAVVVTLKLLGTEQEERLTMTIAELGQPATGVATLATNTTMKALVYHGPGMRAWEDKPRPIIQHPGDAIVRITTSTICGTDLHILKGDLPAVTDGRILGHEGVGVVEQVGTGVSEFHIGDKVIVSCVTACLKCDFCKRSMYSHCRRGGWILGYTLD